MDPIQRLLEAHVQHELARFRSKAFQQSIREEVAAVFQWLKKVKLREIVTADQISSLIARNVVELPISGGISELAVAMSQRVLAAPENDSTAIEDICPRPSFDAAVAKIGQLESVRQDLIHKLVSSSVYTEQISNALYTGIKEYLLTENVLAQKVPGLASLIKLGKFAVNKTMKPLEAAVEKTVKAYIEANLGNTIRRSEKSINEHFDEAHIVAIGDRVWEGIAATRLSGYFELLDGGDMDDFVAIGREFWLHFRETPYFRAIYTDLVQCFYEKYGNTALSRVAAEFGVTEKLVVNELAKTLAQGIETAAAGGFLEQRIRARLENFYQSPQAARAIAGLATASGASKAKPASDPGAPPPAASRRKSGPASPTAKTKAAVAAPRKRPA